MKDKLQKALAIIVFRVSECGVSAARGLKQHSSVTGSTTDT